MFHFVTPIRHPSNNHNEKNEDFEDELPPNPKRDLFYGVLFIIGLLLLIKAVYYFGGKNKDYDEHFYINAHVCYRNFESRRAIHNNDKCLFMYKEAAKMKSGTRKEEKAFEYLKEKGLLLDEQNKEENTSEATINKDGESTNTIIPQTKKEVKLPQEYDSSCFENYKKRLPINYSHSCLDSYKKYMQEQMAYDSRLLERNNKTSGGWFECDKGIGSRCPEPNYYFLHTTNSEELLSELRRQELLIN